MLVDVVVDVLVEVVVEVVDVVEIVVVVEGIGFGVCSLVHPKLITIITNRPIMTPLSFTTRTPLLVICFIYLKTSNAYII